MYSCLCNLKSLECVLHLGHLSLLNGEDLRERGQTNINQLVLRRQPLQTTLLFLDNTDRNVGTCTRY